MGISALAQTMAPFFSSHVLINWLAGIVIASITMTATPRPSAIFTFLLIAKKVHMPRKKASARFSMKTALIKIFK